MTDLHNPDPPRDTAAGSEDPACAGSSPQAETEQPAAQKTAPGNTGEAEAETTDIWSSGGGSFHIPPAPQDTAQTAEIPEVSAVPAADSGETEPAEALPEVPGEAPADLPNWQKPFSWQTADPPTLQVENPPSPNAAEVPEQTGAFPAQDQNAPQYPYPPPFIPQGSPLPQGYSPYAPPYTNVPPAPPYGSRPYPQPSYGAPHPQQPGAYSPLPQQPYAPYGYPPPMGPNGPRPPKKKRSAALNVFLWVLSVLSVGTILGFIGFTVYSTLETSQSVVVPRGTPSPSNPDRGVGPEEEAPNDGEESGLPDFGEVTPPDPNAEKPDIDVPEHPAGISLTEKPTGQALSAEAVYEKVAVSTVTVAASITGMDGEEQNSTGTGIIATADGYIITNAHVVFNVKSSSVKISTLDGEEYDAIVIGVDRSTDLAVLKTNNHNFTPAEFGDADSLKIGEWVIAIGNPGGAQFYASLTRGVISGLNRAVAQYSENGMTYIQTDAAINPGNSGGPLVNMYGQVVGINSSKIITTGYEGMGFAIPISKAQTLINELMESGYIKGRTRLGITGIDYSGGYGEVYGFQIASIGEDSVFAGTKAQSGDVITAVDDNEVYGITSLSNLLLNYKPGDTVSVTLYRPGQRIYESGMYLTIEITLLEDSGETQG